MTFSPCPVFTQFRLSYQQVILHVAIRLSVSWTWAVFISSRELERSRALKRGPIHQKAANIAAQAYRQSAQRLAFYMAQHLRSLCVEGKIGGKGADPIQTPCGGTMKEKLLSIQSLGFVVLIALSWFDECLGLRKLVLGDNPYISDFREAAFEMLFVLTVWFFVWRGTQRLIGRVKHLEGMLHICGWCHRVRQNGKWITLEEFVHHDLETKTSHGICVECIEREKARLNNSEFNGARRRPKLSQT
jgi:hypothetical protein